MVYLALQSLSVSPRSAAILIAAVFSAALWLWLAARWLQGRPIIPFARRRPVPWEAGDVVAVFVVGLILLPGVAGMVVRGILGNEAAAPVPGKTSLSHTAEQLLATGRPGVIAVVVVVAVVVAPLLEELLFRVLLQGWLETAWARRRRDLPLLRHPAFACLPIVLPALFFALMHVRRDMEQPPTDYLAALMSAQAVTGALAALVAIGMLRLRGAARADLGWAAEKIGRDALLAVVALVAVTPPLLAVHRGLSQFVLDHNIHYAPDPLPLFLFALVLGWLYQRTHRLAPSLLLHVAFNATSVVSFFL